MAPDAETVTELSLWQRLVGLLLIRDQSRRRELRMAQVNGSGEIAVKKVRRILPNVTGEYELALAALDVPEQRLDELTQKIKKKRDPITPPLSDDDE